MLKHIDRLMIVGYFKSYIICLFSLLMLYIVVDMFTNLDDFVHHGSSGLQVVVIRIISWYGYRIPTFFDRLCEAIVLLAAMFTVAMMQRNNEQVPLLSAGVSTQRIVSPVLYCAFLMLTLTVINQEMLIPRISHKLTFDRSDADGESEVTPRGGFEPNDIQIEGERAVRKTLTIKKFRVMIPEKVGGNMLHIIAEEARFHPSPGDPPRGKWELTGCSPRNLESIPGVLEVRDDSRYFLHTKNIDFDALVRDPKWFTLASTQRLYQELQRPESTRLAAIAVMFHSRLTRPLLGMVLVLMGLSVILLDQTRNVIISAGFCLVLCGCFFAVVYACKMLGDNEVLSPALAAWLPVVGFGPFAVVLFDSVQT
jgi:lipopolysaccharide export system permease protein